jgi:hypothetical protein
MALLDLGPRYILTSVLRALQIIFAFTVVGLYGTDLDSARKAGVYADGRWVYAVVLGVMSAVTAIVYLVPLVVRRLTFLFAWDWIIFFLWIVLFGIFGKLYIHEDAEGNSGIQRMKNAVWIVLINMLLWFVSALTMTFIWWKERHSKTVFTGRATV